MPHQRRGHGGGWRSTLQASATSWSTAPPASWCAPRRPSSRVFSPMRGWKWRRTTAVAPRWGPQRRRGQRNSRGIARRTAGSRCSSRPPGSARNSHGGSSSSAAGFVVGPPASYTPFWWAQRNGRAASVLLEWAGDALTAAPSGCFAATTLLQSWRNVVGRAGVARPPHTGPLEGPTCPSTEHDVAMESRRIVAHR